MTGSKGNGKTTLDGGRVLNDSEEYEIRTCDFDGLILEEQLILTGVAQILEEFGCNPQGDDKGEDAMFEIPALALWTLGKVARRATDDLLWKLGIARERLRSVGIPEVLKTRLATPSREAATSDAVTIAGSGATRRPAGKRADA